MIITLDIKPLSVNAAWQGRRFKSKEYKRYEREIVPLLLRYKDKKKGLCWISYRFFLTNWKMTDADNLVKVTQDFLVKCGIIEDDRKIMKYTIEKIPSDRNYIQIEIGEIII